MPDDLSSIEGLADKHRRVLARHHVTDLRGLVQADPHVIHRAMANLRPRPTLELISRWQDDARGKLDATADADWQQAASFVVIFSQRPQDGGWERHVEVERTEVEPERDPQVWPGWDCAPVCAWMTSQLNPPAAPAPSLSSTELSAETALSAAARSVAEAALSDRAHPPAEATPPNGDHPSGRDRPSGQDRLPARAGSGSPPPAGRPQLRIDSAALIDAAGRAGVVAAGHLAADPRTQFTSPVRVVLTVSGARPGTRLQAVTRIQRPGAPGWNPRDPVTPTTSGQAEFDLSGVPAGDHEIALIAWAPDASAKPVSVHLPRVTIRGSG